MKRMNGFAAALALALLATAGCGGGGGTVTKQEEDLMRRPVGSTPMPTEAAAAMQKANREAAARSQQAR